MWQLMIPIFITLKKLIELLPKFSIINWNKQTRSKTKAYSGQNPKMLHNRPCKEERELKNKNIFQRKGLRFFSLTSRALISAKWPHPRLSRYREVVQQQTPLTPVVRRYTNMTHESHYSWLQRDDLSDNHIIFRSAQLCYLIYKLLFFDQTQ